MNKEILIKKAEYQTLSVRAARMNLEVRKMEVMAEVERIDKNIEIQDLELKKLEERLKELKAN